MKKSQKENKKQFTPDITAQSYCGTHRDCCRLKGCVATYVAVTGSYYDLGYCGCSNSGIV